MLVQASPAQSGSAHVIVLGNEKGGSGKSTTAFHIAIALFGGEIDRRRCALFAAADIAQVNGLSEPALGVADQEDRFIGSPFGTLYAALLYPWFEAGTLYHFHPTDFRPAPRVSSSRSACPRSPRSASSPG